MMSIFRWFRFGRSKIAQAENKRDMIATELTGLRDELSREGKMQVAKINRVVKLADDALDLVRRHEQVRKGQKS